MHKDITTGGEDMFKRMIGLCTAALMLVSLLPAAVWAEGTDSEQTAAPVLQDGAVETAEVPAELETNVAPEDSIALYSSATSGSCGENVTWNYDTASGTLTISGEGEMWDYSSQSNIAPWISFNPTSAIIENGVTSIGDFSFYWSGKLQSVSLPDSIESIGKSAFNHCVSLTSLKIPEKLTVIPAYFCAFCDKLKSLEIPESIVEIQNGAFYSSGIQEMTIPASVKKIGSKIFDIQNGQLKKLHYEGAKSQWERLDIDSTNSFVQYPDKVTFLSNRDEGTICNGNIKWVIEANSTLRLSVVNYKLDCDIPDYANFSDAPWSGYRYTVGEIIIDRYVTKIGNYAFNSFTNVKEVRSDVYNDDSIFFVASIGKSAFEFCDKLDKFPFTRMICLKEIMADAFHKTTLSGCVELPSNLLSIADHAFQNTSSSSFVLNNKLTSIGNYAFSDSYNLSDFFFRGTTEEWDTLSKTSNNMTSGRVIVHCSSVCKPGYERRTAEGTPATCTEAGQRGDTVCATCGVVVASGTVVPATGHTEVTDVAVAATCGSAGKTEGKHCSVCNEILLAQKEIPATGEHTWDNGTITKPANGKDTGVRTFTCTVCQATKTEPIPIITGDVNGDGKVDITDMALVYEYLTGQKVFDDGQKKAADVVNDGGEGPIVDVYDLQRLYEAVSGIRPF